MPLSGTAALHSKEKKRGAAQKSSFLSLKHSCLLQECRMAVLWEPIDFLHPSILLTGKRDESFEKERLSTPPPFFFTLNFSYYDRKGKVREMKTGSEAVSHDVCVCVCVWATDSDVVTPGHYLIHPPSYLSTFSSFFFPPLPPSLTQSYLLCGLFWLFMSDKVRIV